MKCNLCEPVVWRELPGGIVLDQAAKVTYNNDSQLVVRIKCLAVALCNPLRTLAFVIAAIAKAILLLLEPLFTLSIILLEGAWKGSSQEEIKIGLTEAAAKWTAAMRTALSSPPLTLYYTATIEAGALVGLVNPFLGRKIVAREEDSWKQRDLLLQGGTVMAPCFKPRVHAGLSWIKFA